MMLRPTNIDARIVVDLLKKSAVRRTPNTVPTPLPPKEPANPPPLLDCMRITTINITLINISSVIKKLNIMSPSSIKFYNFVKYKKYQPISRFFVCMKEEIGYLLVQI